MPPLVFLLAALVAAPAPPVFVTSNYGLTFRSPAGASHCPLPDDWTGSDHGTTLFLAPPKACHGAGYPSSSRSATPEDLPRVEVYYGYYDAGDAAMGPPPTPCRRVGTARLLAAARPICRTDGDGLITLSISAYYQADVAAELDLTLVTTAERLPADLAKFRALADSVRTCAASWKNDDGRAFTLGHGAPCPADGRMF